MPYGMELLQHGHSTSSLAQMNRHYLTAYKLPNRRCYLNDNTPSSSHRNAEARQVRASRRSFRLFTSQPKPRSRPSEPKLGRYVCNYRSRQQFEIGAFLGKVSVLGKQRFESFIPQGGFAHVYLATECRSREQFALKVIQRQNYNASQSNHDRVRREIRVHFS